MIANLFKTAFLLILMSLSFNFIAYAQTTNDYTKSGWKKYAFGDYTGAIEDSISALKINSNNFWAYNLRGISRLALQDHKGAIKDFSMAIELDYTQRMTFYNYYLRGIAKAYLGDSSGAILDFDESIKLDAKHHEAYDARGRIRIELGDTEQGCIDLHNALVLGNKSIKKLISEKCKDHLPKSELDSEQNSKIVEVPYTILQ